MSNDILFLRKYLNALLIIKYKFGKSDIAKGVNISIKPLNLKYNVNFRCNKDEEFISVLTGMIKYINDRGNQIISKKIEEEIIKKLIK